MQEVIHSTTTATTADCDPETVVEFLRRLAPDGPWVLWAKEPDGRGLRCSVAFGPDDEQRVRDWVLRHAHWNQYFHVNPYPKVRHDRRQPVKAKKTDIAEVRYLHVDVDPSPPPGDASDDDKAEHLRAERTRIR